MEQAYKELISQSGGTWVHPVYSRYPRQGGNLKSFFKKGLKNVASVGKSLAKNLKTEIAATGLEAAKKMLLENESPKKALLGTLKSRKKDILKAATGAIAENFKKKGAGGKGGAKRTKKKTVKKKVKKGGFKNKKLGTKSAPRTKKIYI